MKPQCIKFSVSNEQTLITVSRMHDQSILLRDGSVLLVGGRTSPIHMCTQVLKIEFISKDPQGSNLICTNCGLMAEDVCQHKENISPQGQVFVEVSSVNSESDSFTNSLCPPNGRSQGHHNTESSGDQRLSSRPDSVNSVNHRPSEVSENRLMNRNKNCGDKGACDKCVCDGGLGRGEVAVGDDVGLGKGAVRGDGGQGGQYSEVRFQEVKMLGDCPSPRWRHAAVLIHYQGQLEGRHRCLAWNKGQNKNKLQFLGRTF